MWLFPSLYSRRGTVDWSLLPQHILQYIMTFVPLTSRHGTSRCCARVCKSWAAAAAAVTTKLELRDCARYDSLSTWLSNHGHGIEVLHLGCDLRRGALELASLPCPNLQQLTLQHCSTAARKQRRLLQSIASCTQLTGLSFNEVQFDSDPNPSLESLLAGLPNLQQLSLKTLQIKDFEYTPAEIIEVEQEVCLSNDLLSGLTQLTSLLLHGDITPALSHLGALTRLQHLDLDFLTDEFPFNQDPEFNEELDEEPAALTDEAAAAAMGALSALTQLTCLRICAQAFDITPDTIPGFSTLTALQSVSFKAVRKGSIDPHILAPATQLQRLQIGGKCMRGDQPGAAELLAVLASMQQLKHLTLERLQLSGLPAAAYSALTASSMLQQWHISSTNMQPQHGAAAAATAAVPGRAASAWQHIFSADRPLPHMQSISIDVSTAEPTLQLQSEDVASLAAACPACGELTLRGVAAGARLTTLSSLSQLSFLQLIAEDEDTACADLAAVSEQLKGLRCLLFFNSTGKMTLAGVWQLTALKQLTGLGVLTPNNDLGYLMDRDSRSRDLNLVGFHNTAEPGAPSDVSQKLSRACWIAEATKRMPHNSKQCTVQ